MTTANSGRRRFRPPVSKRQFLLLAPEILIDFVRVESAVSLTLWQQCLARLQDELPATEFSMWIRPLQAELNDNTLTLYAPNRFVLDWVRDKYLNSINGLLNEFCGPNVPCCVLKWARARLRKWQPASQPWRPIAPQLPLKIVLLRRKSCVQAGTRCRHLRMSLTVPM